MKEYSSIGIIAALLVVALLFWPSTVAINPSPPAFVRGGLVFAKQQDIPQSLHNQALDNVQSIPQGGWFYPLEWQPGQSYAELGRAPQRGMLWPWLIIEPGTGDMATLDFSTDGQMLAVGDRQGLIRVYRLHDGQLLWSKHRANRVIRQLAFGDDSQMLYVAEQGPEGRIAAYAALSGIEKWHFDSSQDLGRSERKADLGWSNQPGAYRLYLHEQAVIVSFTHAPSGKAQSRIYSLNQTDGCQLWRWPHNQNANYNISWFSANTSQIAFTLEPPPQGTETQSWLHVIDAHTAEDIYEWPIQPTGNWPRASFWQSIALADKHLAITAQDGRAWIFNLDYQQQWQFEQSLTIYESLPPMRLMVTNGTLRRTEGGALFITGMTYRWNALDDGSQHPLENTAFAYDWQGKMRWVYKLGGHVQGAEVRQNWLWIGAGIKEHGRGILIDTRLGSEVARFDLKGATSYGGVAMTDDAQWLAIAEYSADGWSRLWILR